MTRNVLTEATRVESVTRVVVTSSCAAIYGDSQDLLDAKGPKFTEQDWNTTSTLDHQPYSLSKVLAEREAWKIAEGQSRFRLVTVNPSLVLGPAINDLPTSESFSIIKQLLDGTMKAGAPDLRLGVVDVRDVAEQHLRAAFVPEASGRYICSAHDSGILDIAASIRRSFGTAYPVPSRTLPKWLVWLVGPFVNKAFSRRMISRNVGWRWHADHGKAVRELEMQFRPLDESTRDMVVQMEKSGLIPESTGSVELSTPEDSGDRTRLGARSARR
jgi:dihydroflavonol-4-reductase